MRLQIDNLECRLTADKPIRLEQALGVIIVCLRGTTWITTTGNFADIFLRAGLSFRIASNKLALLEAVGPDGAKVRIVPRLKRSHLARLLDKSGEGYRRLRHAVSDRPRAAV